MKGYPVKPIAAVLLVAAQLWALAGYAGVVSWVGGNGTWSNGANWSTGELPGAADDVVIASGPSITVTYASGSDTVRSITSQQALELTGGALTVLNNIEVNNTFILAGGALAQGTISPGTWLTVNYGTLDGVTADGTLDVGLTYNGAQLSVTNGLTLFGSLQVGTNGVLDLEGGGDLQLYAAVTNGGVVNWSGAGSIVIYNNVSGAPEHTGGINNLVGATFNAQNDQSIQCGCEGGEYFNNAGLFLKYPTSGATTVGVPFNNNGLLEVDSGTVVLADGGSATNGQFIANAGATLNISDGLTGSEGSQFLGAGTNELSGGLFSLTGTDSGTNLVLSGGMLTDTNFIITGGLTWTGGALGAGASLTIASNAVLNIDGDIQIYGALTNEGTVNWENGAVQVFNDTSGSGTETGAIWNETNAIWNIQCEEVLSSYYGGEQFFNAGTVRMGVAGGASMFDIDLINAGLLDAGLGLIALGADADLTGGTMNFGLAETFEYGQVSFTGAAALDGSISVELTNGFAPPIGASFDLLSYTSQTGGFTNSILPAYLGWETNYGGSEFVLTSLGILPGTLFTWIGPVGLNSPGDWFNPFNWSPNGVPDTNDNVDIANGAINLTAPVTMNAILHWTDGGVLSGDGLMIGTSGEFNIDGYNSLQVQVALTNEGTVNWSGAVSLMIQNGSGYNGGINNLPGAFFNAQNDGSIECGCFGGEYFNNTGLFLKWPTTGQTVVGVPFNNTGTVHAQSGTIVFSDGGEVGGIWQADASTVINLAGGAFISALGETVGGSGTVELTGGTLGLTQLGGSITNLQLDGGDLSLPADFEGGAITNLTLTGAYLEGNHTVSGTLTMTGGGINGNLTILPGAVFDGTNVDIDGTLTNGGTFNWSGGALTNSCSDCLSEMTVLSGGVLNIQSNLDFFGALTNQGTVNWQNGAIMVANNTTIGGSFTGVIWNETNALWVIQCDQYLNYFMGNELFNNAGVVRKSANQGTTYFDLTFNNCGTLDVEAGIVNFNDFSPDLTGGTVNFGIASLTQYGQVSFAGVATLDGSVSVTLAHDFAPPLGSTFLLMSYDAEIGAFTNAILPGVDWQTNYGAFDFTLSDGTAAPILFTWTGPVNGDWFNPANWIPNGVPGLDDNANLTNAYLFLSEPVTNNGTINWVGGGGIQGGALTIGAEGVFNIQGGNEFDLFVALTNAGTVNWSGAVPLFVWNDGAGGVNGGVVNLSSGSFHAQNDAPIECGFCTGSEYFDNAGEFIKSPTTGTTAITVAFDNSGTLDVEAGLVDLSASSPNLTNGTLHLGIPSLTQYGQVNLGDSPTRAGALSVALTDGFTPQSGNTFVPVFYVSAAGAFTSISLPPAIGWLTNYGPSDFIMSDGTPTPIDLTCPGNMVTNKAYAECSQTVAFAASVTGSPPPTLAFEWNGNPIDSPFSFPVGTNVVSCTASNVIGIQSCSFTVTVANTNLPVAGSFSMGPRENTPESIPVAKLLLLDQNPGGGTLSIASVSSPTTNASMVTLANGLLTYKPASNYVGSDTIDYVLSDGCGTVTGVIFVTVTSTNGLSQNGLSIQTSGGNAILQFHGIPGQAYYVQQSSTLTGPWGDLPNNPVTANALGLISYTVSSPTSPSYYRTSTTP